MGCAVISRLRRPYVRFFAVDDVPTGCVYDFPTSSEGWFRVITFFTPIFPAKQEENWITSYTALPGVRYYQDL